MVIKKVVSYNLLGGPWGTLVYNQVTFTIYGVTVAGSHP